MPNIYQRLHAAMGEVDYIQKEKKQGMRYSIVTHDAVTAKVRPILVKHGIVYYPLSIHRTQNGNRTELDMTVRFVNVEDGDFIDVASGGYGLDDQDKGVGKAISYAVKYALLKALGLETGDDPDEDQVTTHKPGVVTSGPKKSSHAIKRDTPEAWPNIVNSFRNARSYAELRDIAASEYVQEMTKDWPVSWTDQLREEYQELADTLRERNAAFLREAEYELASAQFGQDIAVNAL